MKINIRTNLKTKEAGKKIEGIVEKAVKEVVVDVASDSVKGSPVDTGHNRRSIDYNVKGLEGAVYSTSGYGGFLETGTSKMAARPYMKPALDKNIGKLGKYIEGKI